MEIKTTLEKDEKEGKATMKLSIPYEEFGDYLNRASSIHAQEGEVPGFRKGKAPRPRVIAHFGEETIRDFALRLLACEATLEALEGEGMNATGKVHFSLTPVESGKPIEFTADLILGDDTESEPELPWPQVGDEGLEEDDRPYRPPPDYLRRPRR